VERLEQDDQEKDRIQIDFIQRHFAIRWDERGERREESFTSLRSVVCRGGMSEGCFFREASR